MISKYPVEISDQEGITDAVNYLLSGPAGLGQNFDGFSDYNPLIIRPTFARPFTLPYYTTLDASWYIRMPVTSVSVVGGNPSDQITVNFTPPVAYTAAPFQFGDTLRLSGFEDSGLPYDDTSTLNTPTGNKSAIQFGQFNSVATTTLTGTGSGARLNVFLSGTSAVPYSSVNTETRVDIFNVGTGYAVGDTIKVLGTAIGGATPANDLTLTVAAVDSGFYNDSYFVFSSTTTSVNLYTSAEYNWPAITVQGEVSRSFINTAVSTDCLTQVVVDSITQRNFINAQVEFTYTVNTETSPPEPSYNESNLFDIVVQVNRYTIGKNANGNQVFSFQKTISQKVFPEQTGSPTAGAVSAIFTTVIDQELNFGSYAYILEIAFVTAPTLATGVTPGTAGYRTTAGSLVSDGFETAPLPSGAAAGNIQNQSTAGGTQYLNVNATVLSSNNPGVFVNGPVLDVTVWPNALLPEYTVGSPGSGGTVEIFNTRTLSNVQIVGVGGEFTCDTRGLRVGDSVQIQGTLTGTGTITGYASPTLYKISVTNGSTTFTLTTFAGAPIVTTAGTTTGLTFDYDVLTPGTNSGYQPGDVIKILGTDIGGATPLNDLYLTVFTTSLDSNQVPGKFTMGLRNLTTQVIKQ